ncbi:hypothetical protein CGMCC3_g8422 [Colletotrichum fructicola]|nr:uncharacterized protein CGMCC3_g8422 [Colletotrichum fructicola]KAE9575633.1 hypothetical protein CGMCC3_g8422 [Colletotrichum fructicola]
MMEGGRDGAEIASSSASINSAGPLVSPTFPAMVIPVVQGHGRVVKITETLSVRYHALLRLEELGVIHGLRAHLMGGGLKRRLHSPHGLTAIYTRSSLPRSSPNNPTPPRPSAPFPNV